MKLLTFRSFLSIAACLFLASGISFASASNIYIAQNAAGAANGSSCANAYAYTFFNASGNWGSGASQIGPGTTVDVCGTITVAAGSGVLDAQGSGTSSAPVTILFEAGAVLQAPYLGSGGNAAINIGGESYIVVNGGANGLIQSTANGSGLAYQQPSWGIYALQCSNCEVENLTIANLYVHSSVSDTAVDQTNVNAVSFINTNNFTVANNVFHDCGWCINGWGSNVSIFDNTVYNMDHGVAFGPGAAVSNVNIYGNYIHDAANWDATGAPYHHDGIHIFASSYAVTNLSMYNNLFGGDFGQDATAEIFMEDMNNSSNIEIFNNIFTESGVSTPSLGDGFLSPMSGTGLKVFNNTLLGTPGVQGICVGISNSSGVTFENNLVTGCTTLVVTTNGTTFASAGLSNNTYANAQAGNEFNYGGSTAYTLAQWQSATGQDASSTYSASADLSSAGVPGTGSLAIGAGTNLTGLNISALDYTTSAGDTVTPVQRPPSGSTTPWTTGAYGASSTDPVNPPTALSATVN